MKFKIKLLHLQEFYKDCFGTGRQQINTADHIRVLDIGNRTISYFANTKSVLNSRNLSGREIWVGKEPEQSGFPVFTKIPIKANFQISDNGILFHHFIVEII